jgi:hypothetical protein
LIDQGVHGAFLQWKRNENFVSVIPLDKRLTKVGGGSGSRNLNVIQDDENVTNGHFVKKSKPGQKVGLMDSDFCHFTGKIKV